MLWAVLLMMLGIGHPATIDADTPLDKRRRVAAWLTVALFIATFTPIPISLALPQEPSDEPSGQTYDVRFDAPSVPLFPPSSRELTADRRVALSGPG